MDNEFAIKLFFRCTLSYITKLYFNEKSLGLCMGRKTLSRWYSSICTTGFCFYSENSITSKTVILHPWAFTIARINFTIRDSRHQIKKLDTKIHFHLSIGKNLYYGWIFCISSNDMRMSLQYFCRKILRLLHLSLITPITCHEKKYKMLRIISWKNIKLRLYVDFIILYDVSFYDIVFQWYLIILVPYYFHGIFFSSLNRMADMHKVINF